MLEFVLIDKKGKEVEWIDPVVNIVIDENTIKVYNGFNNVYDFKIHGYKCLHWDEDKFGEFDFVLRIKK